MCRFKRRKIFNMYDPYAEFQVYQLATGVPVYVNYKPDCAFAHVDFILGVGAYHDGAIDAGLAHFVEHMVCANSGLDLSASKKFFGSAGGYSGAATYHSGTRYGFKLPIHHARFDEAVTYWVQALFGTTLDEYFEREMSVIESEIKRKYPSVAHMNMKTESNALNFRGTSWAWAPSPAGTLETLANLTPEKVQTFHHQHYNLANLSIVCVGGIEPHVLLDKLNRALVGAPLGGLHGATVPVVEQVVPLPIDFVEYQLADANRLDRSTVSCTTMLPGTISTALIDVACGILSQTVLHEVRDTHGLAYSAGANGGSRGSVCGIEVAAQDVPSGRVRQVVDILTGCIQELPTQVEQFMEQREQYLLRYAMFDTTLRSVHETACEELIKYGRITSRAEDYDNYISLKPTDIEVLIPFMVAPNRLVSVTHR
jgi:predicted Zn-dependent peptidase